MLFRSGGRDGLPCETVLFYNLQDIITLRKFADESGQQEINLDKLQRMQEYAEAQVCRRRILLNYFGEISEKSCGNCDVCHTPPQMFDGTTIVQKALSAIVRTKEKIGFTLMVDILRGTLSPDVVSNKYNEIKTFGAGRDISARDWHDYLLQMLQMGFFEIAYNEDRHLHITPLGQDVLYGKRDVQLAVISREEFTVKSRRKRQREEREAEWATIGQGLSNDLYSRLREVRRQVAAEIGKPAFIVMSDKSLQDLVLKRPTTLEAMADVYGFGEYKAKAYGKPFIEAIKQYAGDNADLPFPEAAPFPEPLPFPDAAPSTKPAEPASYMERQKQLHANAYAKWDDEEDRKLAEYYRQGLSTSEIASLMNRNTGGISSRIKKLGLRDDSDSTINISYPSSNKEKHREYRQELEKLAEMKAEIDKKIEELRKKMEEE